MTSTLSAALRTRCRESTTSAGMGLGVAAAVSFVLAVGLRRTQKTHAEAPKYLQCPITREVMVDPVVVCGTGQTYEREAVESWFCRHQPATDPATNVILDSTQVVPNWAIREALNQWLRDKGALPLPPPAQQARRQTAEELRSRGMNDLAGLFFPALLICSAALCGCVVAFLLSSSYSTLLLASILILLYVYDVEGLFLQPRH